MSIVLVPHTAHSDLVVQAWIEMSTGRRILEASLSRIADESHWYNSLDRSSGGYTRSSRTTSKIICAARLISALSLVAGFMSRVRTMTFFSATSHTARYALWSVTRSGASR